VSFDAGEASAAYDVAYAGRLVPAAAVAVVH